MNLRIILIGLLMMCSSLAFAQITNVLDGSTGPKETYGPFCDSTLLATVTAAHGDYGDTIKILSANPICTHKGAYDVCSVAVSFSILSVGDNPLSGTATLKAIGDAACPLAKLDIL
jgi:hypothetical protein